MRLRILAVALAAVVMWGCGSTQDNAISDPVIEEPRAPEGSGTGGVSADNLPPEPSIAPGSEEDFVVNVGDRVHFGFDRFDLTDEAREVLRGQAEWLRQHGSIAVTIAGHADERGTREYNLALGERRAISVRNFLIALGVQPDRVRTVSYGKERPVDPASTEDAWAKNRRGVTQIDETTVRLTN